MPGPTLLEMINGIRTAPVGGAPGMPAMQPAELQAAMAQRRAARPAPRVQIPPQQIAARRKELMAQGLDMRQALMTMAQEGLVDPRLVQRMYGAADAAAPVAKP